MSTGESAENKRQVLRRNGTLNPRPEAVNNELFADNEFFDPADLLQVKYEMLRAAGQEQCPVSRAARAFGLSRPAFYHARAAFQQEGLAGLLPRKRGPKAPHKLTGVALAFLEQQVARKDGPGVEELTDTIAVRFGVRVHPRTVQRALGRMQKKGRHE